jgi:hypothetical protein
LGYVVGWTNQELQHQKGSIIELVSDGEGDTKFPNDGMVVALALCLRRLYYIWIFLSNWCYMLKIKKANRSKQKKHWNVKHERSKFIGGLQQLKT